MDSEDQKIFKRYAIHVILQSFTFSLLVVFGTLFIYAKTKSIGAALGGAFFEIVGDLIIRGPLVEWWWNGLFRRRQLRALAAGMLITALTSLGIFLVDPSKTYAVALLWTLSAVSSFGTSIYGIPADAIFYRTIGHSDLPGRYSSIIALAQIGGAVLAALASIVLNAQGNFLVLLPLLALMALLSLIPLIGLHLPEEQPIIWKRGMHKISLRTFWANFSGDGRLTSSGIPLILVLLFGSLRQSVSVNAIVLLIAAGLGYFAGKLKDKSKNWPFAVALIGLIFVWVIYTRIKTPIAFVVLGAIEYVCSTVLSIGRDARLSREVANTGQFIESAVAIQMVRALGTLAGVMILIVAYWFTSTLPQLVLISGIFFVVPKGLYAIKGLDKLVDHGLI